MCGILAAVSAAWPIAGGVSWAGNDASSNALRSRVAELSGRMRHRGPDECGVHVGTGFWMGHERLSIVGPHNGHQPIENHAKTVALVANGEIYNHAELYQRLEQQAKNDQVKAPERTTLSDSEIIVHMYEKLGADCVEELLGMFAFVLVEDGGRRVLAARDKIGIKPLYMGTSHDGSEIIFASELKALVDQCSSIQLVPAGHFWTRETGLKRYYFPKYALESCKPLKGEHERSFSSVDECKMALERAVVRRLMADVEVGLLLSGGLDSSIIGAIMMRHLDKLKAQKRIKSFAVGQEGSPDILAARAVSKFLGTEHIEALFTPEMAFQVLDKVVYHMETYEPELIRSSIPNYFLAEKAAKHVKVVLTGEGSDELWSGYLYFHDCRDAELLQHENMRLLEAVQFVNLQRADRMTMAHSLEARVPFFDTDYIEVAMGVDPRLKLVSSDRPCEKWLLRKMYEHDIPPEVVWRAKAMQCEGVGITWVETLQNYIGGRVSDSDFSAREERFPINTPHTKEEYYYRELFERFYPGCDRFVHVWPNGCRSGGAPWKNDAYTREGLKDTTRLKKGHGLADQITV